MSESTVESTSGASGVAIDPLIRAQMEFTPVPAGRRKAAPGRVRSVPARLYVDKFVEHREAFEFLQEVQSRHGQGAGVRTLVRALLHYRDSVIAPLEAAREQANGNPLQLPAELQQALLEFTPIVGKRGNRVKGISARLYIDKYVEHREAAEFVQRQQRVHRDGNNTIVRALLHYRDSVYDVLEQRRKNGRRSRSGRQNGRRKSAR